MTAVERLSQAGAFIFGKTNVPVLVADWQSTNPIFGTTNNPWDVNCTPGGSAVALAAGLTGLEIGSDIGGSVRVPAHFCGLYGHKPTHHGTIPLKGHIPGPPGTLGEPDLAVLGPLARSAQDLDVSLNILAGPGEDRATAWRLQLPPSRRKSLSEYRIAAWIDDPACTVEPGMRAQLEATVAALRKAGSQVDEAARPPINLADVVRTYMQLLWSIMMAGMPPEQIDGQPRLYSDQFMWAGVIGMALLPATAAPVGRISNGLTVVVQIVGPYIEDRTTIDFARKLSDVVGEFDPPPGY